MLGFSPLSTRSLCGQLPVVIPPVPPSGPLSLPGPADGDELRKKKKTTDVFDDRLRLLLLMDD